MKKLFVFLLSFFVSVSLFGYDSETYVTENLRMRSEPNLQGKVICTIKAGSKVQIEQFNQNSETWEYITDEIDGIKSWWLKVSTKEGAEDRDGKLLPAGTQGWVFGGYVKRVVADEVYRTEDWTIVHKFDYSLPLKYTVYLKYKDEEIFLRALDENDSTSLGTMVYKRRLVVTDNGLLVGFYSIPDGKSFPWCSVHCYYIDLKTKKVTYVTTQSTEHNEVSADCYYYKEGNTEYILAFTSTYWSSEEPQKITNGGAYAIGKSNNIIKLSYQKFEELYEKYKKNPESFKPIF